MNLLHQIEIQIPRIHNPCLSVRFFGGLWERIPKKAADKRFSCENMRPPIGIKEERKKGEGLGTERKEPLFSPF